jgi:hypothetical protein
MGNINDELDHIDPILEILENLRELSGAIFIQSQRNYDMLALIAEKLGADVDSMLFKHQQGQVLAPPPSFVFENDEIEE